MKHKMSCDNEVSAKCRESSNQNIDSQGRQGSCNFVIADGADRVDVLMSQNNNNSNSNNSRSIGIGNGVNKPRSRSYACNRFSCNFHQQQNHAFILFIAAVCLLMPHSSNGMAHNYNETETLIADPIATFNLANDQEVNNEILTNLDEQPKADITEEFMESPLSESLEDKIRNAVKNEIEQVSNIGSPALINALNVLPVTPKLVLVRYPQISGENLEKKLTSKIEPPKTVEENNETKSEIKIEASCDSTSLVCNRVVKQDANSIKIAEPDIIDHSTTTAAALPVAHVDATTTVPIIEIEAVSTIEPIDSTISPKLSEEKEDEFDVIEDNMREARNLEIKTPETEEIKKIEDKINLKLTNESTILISKALSEHKNHKDLLKSVISIDEDTNSKANNNEHIEEIHEKSSTDANVELQALDESATSEQPFLTDTETTETNLKGDINNEFDILQNQQKLNATEFENKVEASNEQNDLSGLISQPLMDELGEEITLTENTILESKLNSSLATVNSPIEEITFIKPTGSEISENFISTVSAEDITTVIADHTDLYTPASTNVLNETVDANEHVNLEITNENSNETLSITFKEPLTAIEPNILLEDSKDKDLLNFEETDADMLPAEFTTITPEVVVHNVIKKQGVEALVDDSLLIASTTPTPIDIDTTIKPQDSDSLENITTDSTSEPEPIATTIKLIENTAHNTNDVTDISVTFAGKGDDDAVLSAKGYRSVNSIHTLSAEHHKASINLDIYPAGQTFNDNLAEEVPNGVGKALRTQRHNKDSSNNTTAIITVSSCTALLFIVISVTIFLVSFQRQHGTLDIEMQEQRCGKDIQDDEPDSCIKLLDVELPNTSLALQTEAEAEIEVCL